MTAIEPQQDVTNPRKKLYSALVGNANPEAKSHFKKFSFEQFNKRLDDEKFVEELYQSLRDNDVVLDPKNRQPEQNYYDFIDAYVKVPTAKPAAPVAKPAAAPVAAAPIEQAAPIPSVEPMEEEEIPEVEYEGKMLPEVTAYGNLPKPGTQLYEEIMKTNPPVGSDEYNLKIAVQNQLPPVELGAGGYGGVLQPAFENTAQIEQESESPAFRRQKLAEAMMQGEVPVVTKQGVRKAQEGFGKMTKEQQQAAIMGGPGAELKKATESEKQSFGERSAAETEAMWEQAKNAGINIFAGLATVMQTAALNETPMDDYEREYYVGKAWEQMYETSDKANKDLQNELYRLNVSNDVLNELEKGNYSKIPEATLQTIANVGVSAIASLFTAGGSMYFQSLPDVYREGVDAIAKEQGITPEEVIRNGDDAKIVAQTAAGIIAALERAGAGRLSKSIANKGGYKAVRDYLIRKGFGKTIGRAAGIGYASLGEGFTEYVQQGTQQLSRIVSASKDTKRFLEKLPKEFFSRAAAKERLSAGVGGLVGGGGMVSIGRGVGAAFQKGPNITQFSPEVQGNEIIQEATRGYQDNIARAEEQGRKPDAYNKRELNKLATDPEAWVKGEIKYLTQTIQDNKKNNIDSKVEETKLSRANALLAQIKAEKKGMEQAALAPAQEAAPVAPEAPVAPAETITAPEITTPAVTIPAAPAVSDAEMDANIEEGQKRAGFVYESPLESLTGDAKSIIQSVGRNKYISLAPVKELFAELYDAYRIFARQKASTSRNLTTAQIDEGIADFEETLGLLGDYISQRDSGKFVREYTGRKQQEEQAVSEITTPEAPATETAPVTEEAPVAEETIPVAPETEEDYSFLEETELTPEEEAALLAQEETAPVAPVEEEVVTEEVPAEPVAPEAAPETVSTAPVEEAAPEAPAAPAPKGKVEVVFPTTFEATEVKPYAEVEDNYYRPDQQLKLNQGTYEPVRIIAHPDVIRAMSIGSKLRDNNKRKTVTNQEIEFADGVAKRLGFTTESGKGNAIMLHNAARDLAKQNRSSTQETFVVIGEEQGGKKKAPAPKAETKQEAPKKETKKEEAPKTEAKPVSTTPKEGDTIQIAPQREGFQPRSMVFKDGEWKQNVGGDILKVGPAVQQQAQEAFAGKEETKPAETKFKPNPKAAYYISKGADEVYYTLREIGGDDLDVHVMNLSKDLEESKRKAKELIGEDVEFDETSLGRDYNKIKADKTGKGQQLAKRLEGEGVGMNTLSFGKYNGKTIDEVFEIDKPYILYLNKEYSNNTVFQKGVRDNPKIKEFIEQSLSEKEQQRKNLENLTEIGGIKFDDKGVAKAVPIKGKIKYINNRMGPQGMYKVYILDTEYGVPVEVSGDIGKFADGKLEQGAELSFTANVQKVGDKFKVIGRKSEYTKPIAETKTETAQKEEGKKPSAKELASQVEDMRSLPPAKRKAAQQALEERYGKEDVEKMIEITANFTKIIDDLEKRGVVKIDCP